MRCFLATLTFVLALTSLAWADQLVLVAGTGKGVQGVPATEAKMQTPFGVDFDKEGNAYIVEMTGHRVLKVDRKGVLHVIAGTGNKGDKGDGGPAASAEFNGMHSLAVARSGEVFLADTWNNRVRKLDPKTGAISTIIGSGKKGFSGDGGPASKADFGGIYSIAFDSKGEKLYIADLDNRRIRMVNLATGIASTVAGNGKKGVPADGAIAKDAPLVDPRAVTVDSKDNVYILERSGHALRVVDSTGKIRTVAGTGKAGLSGDGGPAKDATLNGPKHLCIDLNDNVLIADSANHVVRKYQPGDSKIVRVAGSGKKGNSAAPADPLKMDMNEPHGVWVHRDGTLYIADSNNHRVLKLVR